MPQYPTPSAYQEAVQFPETAFADPDLQAAAPRENALGLPQPITGAFAAVFPMRANGSTTWAAKCFLSAVEDQPRRYRAIAKHLDAEGWPHAVPFDYQPEGIRVGEADFPLLKMEWVEGVPVNRYVEAHLEDADALAQLAERWAALLRDLDEAGIAHGDLQHGNVLVTGTDDGPRLTLVDYDTMFVPALKGRKSAEVGHRNFQHPDRTERDFGPFLDRFAGLVVGVGLEACRLRPDLWPKYDTGENLLFRAADFYDPAASPLFAELSAVDALSEAVEALRTACYLEPEAVPSWTSVRTGEVPSVSEAAARKARRQREHPEAQRSRFARAFLPCAALALVVTALLALLGGPVAALVVLTLAAAGALGAAGYAYRRQPLVRRRLRLSQETDYFERVIESMERQVGELEAQRREVRATVEERRAARLQELREEALYDRLKYHFIGEVAAVEGLSHKTVVRLKASGIRTAYQATEEELQSIRQMGEKSRARVALWRAGLVAEYAPELPEVLSDAEGRRVRRYVAHRVENLEAEAQRAREKIAVQKRERAEAAERRGALPALSFGRYLRYLARLDTLPSLESAPPPPQPAPPQPAPSSQPAGPASATSENEAPESAASTREEDAPWWRRH